MKFKIVDDSGRLLGSVNVIDFGIMVLLAVLAFSLTVPLINIVNRNRDRSPGFDKVKVLLTVKSESVMTPIAMAIKEGAVQRDPHGRVVATLRKILEANFVGYRNKVRVMVRRPTENMDLVLQFVATAYRVKNTGNYYYAEGDEPKTVVGSNILRLGERFVFRQSLYTIGGVIVGLEPMEGKDLSE